MFLYGPLANIRHWNYEIWLVSILAYTVYMYMYKGQNFQTPKIFAVFVNYTNHVDGIANSVDPGQTAALGTV